MKTDPGSRYADIIDHPHHVSTVHPRMSMHDRAAQFAPFAALTGHSDAIDETGRKVEEAVLHEIETLSVQDSE